MTRPQDCRKRIVQAALKLFASRGYYHTSIADILRESGCKRGSLYHYFSSKEELGYAVIDESIRLVLQQGAGSHLLASEHPIDRMIKMLDELPGLVKLETTHAGVVGIAARMAAVHEGFRQRLERSVLATVDELERAVRRSVAEGQIADSVDPDQLVHMFATIGLGIQYGSQLLHRKVIWEDARRWLKEYLNSLRR